MILPGGLSKGDEGLGEVAVAEDGAWVDAGVGEHRAMREGKEMLLVYQLVERCTALLCQHPAQSYFPFAVILKTLLFPIKGHGQS